MEGERENRDPGIVHDWRRFKTPGSVDRGGGPGIDVSTISVRAPHLGVEFEYSPDLGERLSLTDRAVACCMSRLGRLAGAHCSSRP